MAEVETVDGDHILMIPEDSDKDPFGPFRG